MSTQMINTLPVGRFAPSPSGRMHLGNIYTAILSWLSVKSRGGKWILRIEDLDPQRSKYDYARLIEDDLLWLGLEWDEGGLDNKGPHGPYMQSQRFDIYEKCLVKLKSLGRCYPCHCTRADIMATRAPHESDGHVVYKGTCRPTVIPSAFVDSPEAAIRLAVPDQEIAFVDRFKGPQTFNLAVHCGDFILRRADGAWAYQLAVVADDALMGITEVVRGEDLLLSTPQQIYLYNLLGFDIPEFAHIPLIRNQQGIRLSKRDKSLSMDYLRKYFSPNQIIGKVASLAHLTDTSRPLSLQELTSMVSI